MWYAFTMDHCVAVSETKRDLIYDIYTGYKYRVKRIDTGFYLYEEKRDDGYWYETYYLCSSVKIAKKKGFSDQLEEYFRKET